MILPEPAVELGHHGALCSFDAILDKHRLDDPALRHLARIVRGADTLPVYDALYAWCQAQVGAASAAS